MGTRGSKSTGQQGSGHSSSSGTGSGISFEDFWLPFRNAIEARGWDLISNTDFALAAKKSDWVIGMVDGTVNEAGSSFDLLDRWAEERGVARSRLLVSVYPKALKKDIDRITKKLQRGTRMLPQAMGAVIHIQGGAFYRPDVPGITWHGAKYPIFDEQVGRDIEAALQEVLRPR
jgi:hypothetical protein